MTHESSPPQKCLSVSEIGEHIENALLGTFPDSFWVKGEITDLSNKKNLDLSKGYVFCGLKDDKSQISLYFPSSTPAFRMISSLKDGTEVYIYGKINYYTEKNSISIRVFSLLISGEGELRRQFEIVKKRLEEEGLFDAARKKPIPLFPRCVGVITSSSGAALQDILHRTKQKHGALDIIVFPVSVQGKLAAQEIAQAITVANTYFKNIIDVLIVGRGGGSVEDLWAFNEEIVARAIHSSEIPIISAVGHEVDWTIADYVADLRAPTPTAAAEYLMREIVNQNRNLQHYSIHLWTHLKNRFVLLHHRLTSVNPKNFIKMLEKRFLETKKSLSSTAKNLLFIEHRLEKTRLHLDNLSETILTHHYQRISHTKNTLHLFKEKLIALNPDIVLKRGYSITYLHTPEGKKILRSSREVSPGDFLTTTLALGEVESKVHATKFQKMGNAHPNETA